MLDLDWACLTMLRHDTGAEEAERAWLGLGPALGLESGLVLGLGLGLRWGWGEN